ncbi:inositol monophosphatase family protein [Nocardioides euryhalodurans]|uniref:inositol monophosphatase family protein n=1 Tax=Nocardioides euryhalodurans TaxID=2518370 RepID=UPI001ABE25C3|nr:inositol monophosphatase [Nocardioides euryhalodurans]
MLDTDAVLDLIREVAEKVINPRFRALSSEQVDEKGPGDLVTVADKESERLLTRFLVDAYPEAVVLGEEAYAARPELLEEFQSAEHAFTVDPVDGTKNFVKGSPDHAVMVAEVRAGETVRSWIWQPQHELAYVAEVGAGAWRNGERLTRPTPAAEPADWRGVTSRWRWLGRSLGDLEPLKLTWVCCGVDYPKLVEGEADFVVYGRANPWDHAPGSLLLSEAGGYAGTHDGRPYRPTDPLEVHERPAGLLAAADRATYEHVVPLL